MVVYQIPAIDNGDFPGYHGYWLENYDDAEPHFGSWDELNDLVATAHANGLKILIDLVVNHAGYGAQLVGTDTVHQAADVSRRSPVSFSRGDVVTFHIAGYPLAPGEHRFEVEVFELNLGSLQLALKDTVRA